MKSLFLLFISLLTLNTFGQWDYLSAGTLLPTRIEAVSEDLIVGVGSNYDVCRSDDGGLTWEYITTDYQYSFLNDIDFVDDQIGYICGGTYFGMYRCCLLKTIDAGQTWDTISANHSDSYEHHNLSFPSESIGFLTLDYGYLLKTTDGGESFVELAVEETETNSLLHDVEFLNEDVGFVTYTQTILGELEDIHIYRIYKTIDQGDNWEIVFEEEISFVDYTETKRITELFILDENHIYGSGDNGRFIKSEDGGETWEFSTIAPGSTELTALSFVTPEIGFTNNAGIMHRTEDGGETWSPQTTNPLCFVDDIYMINEEVGYFVGNAQWGTRYLQKTLNAGGSLSIDEIENRAISIFPNPVGDFFQISLDLDLIDANISLFDISGRLIKKFELGATHFDISDLETGNYMIRIQKDYRVFSFQVVKE